MKIGQKTSSFAHDDLFIVNVIAHKYKNRSEFTLLKIRFNKHLFGAKRYNP